MPRSPRRAALGTLALALSTSPAAVAFAAPAAADTVSCPAVAEAAFDRAAPGTVTAVFVVGCDTELTLTSANAAARETFAAGPGALTVPVPDCGGEVVLTTGDTVVAKAAGEPCGALPAARIGDALCFEQGALVELANTGDAPVTFSIAAGGTVVDRTVPAQGEGSEIVRLPAGVTDVTVSAPGMDPVSRSVELVCTAVAAETLEAPAAAVPVAVATTRPRLQPTTAGATLPRTGASTTATLAVAGTTLLLTGLALLGAPVVGRRRVATDRPH